MYLVSLVYASHLKDGFGANDIKQIVEASQKNNAKVDVSGMLVFDTEYFLQCLEGSRSAVNNLYMYILRDTRHTNVMLLDYKEIDKREFAHWSMGYIPNTAMSRETVMKYAPKGVFNPMEMSGSSAHGLLVELSMGLPKL